MRVDLRSDTVTQPCRGMRTAMAEARVGDDVYGEDPTVRELEEQVAAELGREAALFVPTGTMANQIALQLHCRPGDEVVVAQGTHCMIYESGGASALAGVQFGLAAGAGVFDAASLDAAIGPQGFHAPRTSLLVVENTHNRAGGVVWPVVQLREVADRARAHGLAVHLDGARLWNASVATGEPLARFAKVADTVSVCFSKGLGAPVGSALVGDARAIERGRRLRKMLGGGMRQAGVLAAAALHGMRHHVEHLEQDHVHARRLYDALSEVASDAVGTPQSNIVNFKLGVGRNAEDFVREAGEEGVLCGALDPRWVRLVTHRDLSTEHIEHAGRVLARLYRSFAVPV